MGEYQRGYNKNESAGSAVEYQQISSFKEDLAAIKHKGLWGYINKKGEQEIPCQFHSACDFSEGMAVVQNEKKLEGYIDKKGKLVIPYQYVTADDFSEGLALVETNQEPYTSFINPQGEVVIEDAGVYAEHFREGLATVAVETEDAILSHYINKEGQIVIETKYDDAFSFKNGFAMAETKEHTLIINTKGEEILKVSLESDDLLELDGDFALRITRDSFVVYNLTAGTQKKLTDIDALIDILDGVAILENTQGKMGACNKDGKIIIPFIYESLQLPSEGLVTFLKDGMYGFIDYEGNVVIPAKYDRVHGFSSGLARVWSGKKEFFINQKGEIAFYIKRKEKSKSIVIIIGIILFWIALIILAII